MDSVMHPEKLMLNGNLHEKWLSWKQDFLLYLQATEAIGKDDLTKSSILLHCIGKPAREIYNTFTFNCENEKMKYDDIIKQFDIYFNCRRNEVLCRFTFFTARQKENETFTQFVDRLTQLSSDCGFQETQDLMMRDMIIAGVKDRKLQEALLCEEELDLASVLKSGRVASQVYNCMCASCQQKDYNSKYCQDILKNENESVGKNENTSAQCENEYTINAKAENTIIHCEDKNGNMNDEKEDTCVTVNNHIQSINENTGKNGKNISTQFEFEFSESSCVFNTHGSSENRSMHSDSRSKHMQDKATNTSIISKVHQVKIDDLQCSFSSHESEGEFFDNSINGDEKDTVITSKVFKTINGENVDSNEYISSDECDVVLQTNGTDIIYRIDANIQVNIMPYHHYKLINKRSVLKETNVKLTDSNGIPLKVKGKCILRVRHKQKMLPVLFIVADMCSFPILGPNTSRSLNLIKSGNTNNNGNSNSSDNNNTENNSDCSNNNSTNDNSSINSTSNNNNNSDTDEVPDYISEFSDCFQGLGCLSETFHIAVDTEVSPVIDTPRYVPERLREKLEKEIEQMLDLKVITPVYEESDWVSSIIVLEKPNGSLRICIDPKNINKAIKQHQHQLVKNENIISQMSGAKFFTKLDVSNAYWQLMLDEASSELLTFNTHIGKFRFIRMPGGIHSANEIYEAAIWGIINGISGCINSQDGIVVWGSSKKELHERTYKVLCALQTNGVKLNKVKCLFSVTELVYLGDKFSEKGIEADPAKVEALISLPNPTNQHELEMFLDMVSYLGKFIPNLPTYMGPLYHLLEDDGGWHFEKRHIDAAERLKYLLTVTPVIKFNNSKTSFSKILRHCVYISEEDSPASAQAL